MYAWHDDAIPSNVNIISDKDFSKAICIGRHTNPYIEAPTVLRHACRPNTVGDTHMISHFDQFWFRAKCYMTINNAIFANFHADTSEAVEAVCADGSAFSSKLVKRIKNTCIFVSPFKLQMKDYREALPPPILRAMGFCGSTNISPSFASHSSGFKRDTAAARRKRQFRKKYLTVIS